MTLDLCPVYALGFGVSDCVVLSKTVKNALCWTEQPFVSRMISRVIYCFKVSYPEKASVISLLLPLRSPAIAPRYQIINRTDVFLSHETSLSRFNQPFSKELGNTARGPRVR